MRSLVLILIIPFMAVALSTGVIAGLVEDTHGQPLIGATVIIDGTPFGAMTTSQGEYVIAGLMPGTYTVQARMVGRATAIVEMVVVESDNLSRIDFQLQEDATGSTVILVKQSRTAILRDIPATAFQLDFSQMRTMSASTVVDMIATQPGVMHHGGELHVRGGRAGEVDYVLDGISLCSPMDNRFNFDIPVSAISTATLMTGGLDIEYGNALSGIVDISGKEGTDRFQGTFRGGSGDVVSTMISAGEQIFAEVIDIDQCRKDMQSAELSLSGPEPITQSILPSMGIEIPGKMTICVTSHFSSSGKNNIDTRDSWSYNWLNDCSAMVKLSYRPVPRTICSFSAVGSYREHGWNQWAWAKYGELGIIEGHMYSPGSQDYALPAMFGETGGIILNISHLIGDKTSMKIAAGIVKFQNWNRIYDPDGGFLGEGTNPQFWLTQYSPRQYFESQLGFYYDGIHQNVWHDSKATVSTWRVGVDINPNPRARLKIGVSGKSYDLYQYNAYSVAPGNAYITLWNANPFSAAVYAQGSYRFSGGGILTAGLRADYFNANTDVFSLEAGERTPVDSKIYVSPRFSFSVPFSERSIFFATMGDYCRMPTMNSLYMQTSFNMGAERVIAGNPDLEPELTELYEFGLRQELDQFSDLAISFYNKEITGLVSTEDRQEGANYVFTNDDSRGNVRGLETSLSRMSGSRISGQMFYTLSFATGKYSSMLQRYNSSRPGADIVSREENFLDWDQTHQTGITTEYSLFDSDGPEFLGVHPLENTSAGFSWKFGSGTPYSLPPEEGEMYFINSERKPYTMQTDIFVTREFNLGIGRLHIMTGIFNLFNRRNITHIYDTSIYHASGDPTGEMSNPRAWSPARHFRFSAAVTW